MKTNKKQNLLFFSAQKKVLDNVQYAEGGVCNV